MTIERNPDYWQGLVKELCNLPHETEWAEFKENNCEPEQIGEYISALSNSAALHDEAYAYLVWGIQDKTHEFVGTSFVPSKRKVGNEPLENWLSYLLSPKVHLDFYTVAINNLTIVILEIGRALKEPIKFRNIEYIRVGSAKKLLREFPEKERLLWKIFDKAAFEYELAAEYISDKEVLHLLDCPSYFELMNLAPPLYKEQALDALQTNSMIAKGKHGQWDILNLGAILFAKNLNNFKHLKRKTIRVIHYEGNNKLKGIAESENTKGYACGFNELINYIHGSIPKNEVIEKALRRTLPLYPLLAVRELVANAIIHQDFTITGAGPIIEIFSDRIEITNPGKPLLEVNRFLRCSTFPQRLFS